MTGSAQAVRVLGVCGSLQRGSANRRVLYEAASAPPDGVDLDVFDSLRDLPHFDPDLELDGVPEPVARWRAAILASDALLIACPEYGFSLPGVLKNGIDWVIGSGELERKVVATTAIVAGPTRGLMGLAALHQTLSAVSAERIGGAPIVRGPTALGELLALLGATAAAVHATRAV